MRNNGDLENTKDNYRGVRQGAKGEWHAEIQKPQNGKRLWLGSFSTARDGALAYDRAAVVLLGPTAKLNLPHWYVDPKSFDHSLGLTLKMPGLNFVRSTSSKAVRRDLQEIQHDIKVETSQPSNSSSNIPDTEVVHCHKKPRSEHVASVDVGGGPVMAGASEVSVMAGASEVSDMKDEGEEKIVLPIEKWDRFLEERDSGKIPKEEEAFSTWMKFNN